MAKKTITDEQIQKRKYWKRHIEEWRRAGSSQAEYCRGQRLSAKSFTYWEGRFRQKSAVSFVPVEVKPEAQMPDDELMKELEGERKGRWDDYPVRAVWNSILAGIVYQHVSIESLRRELMRNGELRQGCGFDPALGERAVPSKDAYSLMLKKLIKKQEIIDRMFERLVEELKKYLTDFGRHVAIDSKKIESYARGKKDAEESSDAEADWGRKTYKGKRADGSIWEKISSWFGYKLHLLVDMRSLIKQAA